jgi:glycosyltransferase involved in cell wall biosynthesis
MFDVSIIIPNYNRKSLISQTLNSVNAEDHPNVRLEVIVVDDGSTDGSVSHIRNSFPWVKVLTKKHGGAPSTRNFGLNNSKGKYVLFLDSDDLIEPDFFPRKLEILKTNEKIAGVYGPWRVFAHETELKQEQCQTLCNSYPIYEFPVWKQPLVHLLSGRYIVSHAILWRKEILVAIHGQNESLSVNQDVELMFRILNNRKSIMGCHAPMALVRNHEGTRVGRIGDSEYRLRQIYDLRNEFVHALKVSDNLDQECAKALGTFCFQVWMNYRLKVPKAAELFRELYRDLYPELQLNARLPLRLLGRVIGADKAYLLRRRAAEVFNI